MKDRVVHLNLNIVLALLLVASVAVSVYLCVHIQGVYSILREYNAMATLVQSDINDMSAHVQEWRTAVSYQETYLNYFYLKTIADEYNEKLPTVEQNLLDYKNFLERNSDLLVSISINAPLEMKNVDTLLDNYDENVGDFSTYLQNVLEIQQNATAS